MNLYKMTRGKSVAIVRAVSPNKAAELLGWKTYDFWHLSPNGQAAVLYETSKRAEVVSE